MVLLVLVMDSLLPANPRSLWPATVPVCYLIRDMELLEVVLSTGGWRLAHMNPVASVPNDCILLKVQSPSFRENPSWPSARRK